jgi:hypothetical protein
MIDGSPPGLSRRVHNKTCDDHMPSFSPRRSSAAGTWARFRRICRFSDHVAAADDLREEMDGR